MSPEVRFVRYRHKTSDKCIEYDVEEVALYTPGPSSGLEASGGYEPKLYPGPPDPDKPGLYVYDHLRIRTVRNISLKENVHQPAFTFMPAEGFLSVYEMVGE
jgi:hypothetical protein